MGDVRGPAHVAEAGADADANAGLAFDRTQDPDQGHRAVAAPELREARREVGDLEGAAFPVPERGDEDRGVLDVALPALDESLDLDVESAALVFRGAPFEEARENGVAVGARHARPRDAPAPVDERGEGAVADHSQVEIGLRRAHHAATASGMPRSHATTLPTSGRW